MSAAVEVTGVTKAFGAMTVLDRVDLRVGAGEIYGLLGPNGAGKTTLIRAIVGLVRPDAGTITVLGRPIPDRHVLAEVGYMTQASAVYADLTVQENVRFFAAIHGAGKRANEVIEAVGLAERATSIVATLSGGMRQRVSLACALVNAPRLLLLDEPTVGVDPQLRAQLWTYFRDMADGGAAIIISSHVMDEAERCDRLGLMRAGVVLAEGTSAELRERANASNLEDAFLKLSEPAG